MTATAQRTLTLSCVILTMGNRPAEVIRAIDSVLAHTASLTSAIAGKDKVIGQVIDNLNSVLGTVNGRTAELTGLIDQVQQLSTGLAGQRQPIGEAIAALGELTESTAGLVGSARPALHNDLVALGQLSANLAAQGDTVDKFLSGLPHKVEAINRVSSYGGWFNYFLCRASGHSLPSDVPRSAAAPSSGCRRLPERRPRRNGRGAKLPGQSLPCASTRLRAGLDQSRDDPDAEPTSVPISSPRTTRSMFPWVSRLKTTMGTSLSMHRVRAVLSMTSMPRFKTSR